jgi:hypothetical protein
MCRNPAQTNAKAEVRQIVERTPSLITVFFKRPLNTQSVLDMTMLLSTLYTWHVHTVNDFVYGYWPESDLLCPDMNDEKFLDLTKQLFS